MSTVRVREERSFGELLGELSEDVSTLMRQEVRLARAEMSRTLSRATTDAVKLGAGALVALAGGLTVVAALVLGLIALGLAAWVSALIIGALLGVIGYVMLRNGLQDLKRVDPTPHRTVETLRDDLQWVKEQRP
ncbi:MAG: phage holin family protein [Bacillota bacterium]|jgi:cytochrome c-type biogenesis protein CcmH/NrfG